MNKDLTIGKPSKALLLFCLPLLGSVIFQQLYNLADSWVAGRFIGENALAAVGNSYEITFLYLAFALGCNMGCSVITSRYFGAKAYGKMKTAIFTSIISSVITCAVLILFGILLGGQLLNLINTPAEIFDDSLLYLNIYTYGLFFVFFYNIANGIFSALGDSKTPFIFLAISSLSNIGVDILFVKTFNMGVAGVAWATFLCQSISSILAMVVVLIRLKKIKTEEMSRPFSFEMFGQFIKIAIPTILQQSFISVGNIIIQGLINGFGKAVIAGYSAAIKLNNMIIVCFAQIGNGISNYCSQNIGAGKGERIKPGFVAGAILVWCVAVPSLILFAVFPNELLSFFINNPSEEALKSGSLLLRIVSPCYIFCSLKLVADGFIRGAGMMNKFMIATFTDLLIRVVLSIILAGTSLGYVGIWVSWPIGWLVAVIMSLIFFFTTDWIKLGQREKV